jgi:hypothetical protein
VSTAVTANQIHSAIFSLRPAPSMWAATAAAKLIEMCSDANAATLCGVLVAGSARKATRWSSSTCWRRVTSEWGSPAKSAGEA